LTIIAIYIDDILLIGSNLEDIQALKHNLHAAFGIKDLGLLHYFWGFEVSHLLDGISLTQTKFTQELLKESGHLNTRPMAAALPFNCKVMADIGIPLEDTSIYRTFIGKLNFLSTEGLIFLLLSRSKVNLAKFSIISHVSLGSSAQLYF